MLSDARSLQEMEACLAEFWNKRLIALKNRLEGHRGEPSQNPDQSPTAAA